MSKIRNFIFVLVFILSLFFSAKLFLVKAANPPAPPSCDVRARCTPVGGASTLKKYYGNCKPGFVYEGCRREKVCLQLGSDCKYNPPYAHCLFDLLNCGPGDVTPTNTPLPTSTPTPPQTCGPLYYCYTANNSYTCRPTSPIYNPTTHVQCGASATCEQNIAAVFPGQTTGICYPSTANCLAGCVRPPTPTLSPTPTTPPVPRCQQMSVFLAGADITGDLSRIKFGDTVMFKAYAPIYAGQIVRSITFEIFKDGLSTGLFNVPAGIENNRWVATYSYVVNSYGSFLVKVRSINL